MLNIFLISLDLYKIFNSQNQSNYYHWDYTYLKNSKPDLSFILNINERYLFVWKGDKVCVVMMPEHSINQFDSLRRK